MLSEVPNTEKHNEIEIYASSGMAPLTPRSLELVDLTYRRFSHGHELTYHDPPRGGATGIGCSNTFTGVRNYGLLV